MSVITLRQKKIIKKLCKEKKFITMSKIGKELEISSKTVERELYFIEEWLNKNNAKLEKKTRYGIKIITTDKSREELLDQIDEEDGIMLFSQEDRRILSLVKLLKQKEPIKLYTLAKNLNVTESTISNDLDKLDTYLEKCNLVLVRKPGLGVYIDGEEKDIRRISMELIYNNVGLEHLMAVSNNYKINDTTMSAIKKRVLNLISLQQLPLIDSMIREIERDLNMNFVETSFIGIVIHILLMIERIKIHEPVTISSEVEIQVENYKEFILANKIKEKIQQHLQIELPKSEVIYLTIQLRGLKSYNKSVYNGNLTAENLKIIKTAKDIIKIAEKETGTFLDGDGNLFVGLVNHLIPAINRLSMGLDIRNPIIEEIKKHYPSIFKISSICGQLIEERFNVKVPDTEIGYIAMHLGGAIVKNKYDYEHTYQVVISCVLGIGSSVLLKSKVEKEFPNIKVKEIIPMEKAGNDYLKDSKVDFIISTVETSNDYKPTVCVNPLLFKEDKLKIEQLIADLKRNNIGQSVSEKTNHNIQGTVDDLKESIEGISHILHNFYIHKYDTLMTLEDIIADISKFLGRKEGAREKIETSLIEREKYGNTVLAKENAMLLHCRTEGVEQVNFQVIRLSNELEIKTYDDKKEKVDLIILMVVPEQCNTNHLDVLRYISQSMIEKERFIEILRIKNVEELKKDLKIMLLDYYTGKF